MRKIVVALIASLGICASLPAGAATLIIDADGELSGATGVDIGGLLFDVRFVDGSCITVFGGCNSGGILSFPTRQTPPPPRRR